MRPNSIVSFCAKFNQHSSLKSNHSFFQSDYTKKVFSLIWCFDRNRYIQAYRCLTIVDIFSLHTINSTFSFKVYPLFYSNFPLASRLSLKSTKKQFFTFSLVDITKYLRSIKNNFTPVLIIDANLGYLTSSESVKLRLGGILFCVLYRFTIR